MTRVPMPFDQAFAIAHAMNNLLAIVAGKLDDIQEAPLLVEDIRDAAAVALLVTERAARLMRGMMASLNGQAFRAGRCNSQQVLRGVRSMRLAPGLAPIELDDSAPSVELLCDPVVLSDLLGNTLDALTEPAGGPIRVGCTLLPEVAPHLPPGRFAELQITCGMPDKAADWRQRALGEDWQQALVGFCHAAGGEVLIEPIGAGADLLIRLRLPGLPGPRPGHPARLPQERISVLLVEDDEPVRRHAERVIGSLGYAVLSVPGAEAALEIIGSGSKVDIVFTDVILPDGMSGGELAEHLQRVRPNLPVVFTSGHNADTCVSRLMLTHGATLLPKPYRRSGVAAALEAALARDRATVPD